MFPWKTCVEVPWDRGHSIFFLVVLIGLGLYLPLLTQNYDINGLAEAAAVQSGRAVDLWNPNHMLYRPIGHFVWQSLSTIGLVLPPIPLLQSLSAVFGATGAGLCVSHFGTSHAKPRRSQCG
jgi:hypothetical protein